MSWKPYPPGEMSVVQHLGRAAHAGGSGAVAGNAEAERHGHQGGVTEAARQGVGKAYESMNLCPVTSLFLLGISC